MPGGREIGGQADAAGQPEGIDQAGSRWEIKATPKNGGSQVEMIWEIREFKGNARMRRCRGLDAYSDLLGSPAAALSCRLPSTTRGCPPEPSAPPCPTVIRRGCAACATGIVRRSTPSL